MKDKVGVGWLEIGNHGVYTISIVRDSEGRCNHAQVGVNELPELGIKRHPNFGKTRKFFNSEEGLDLLDKIKGDWFTEFKRSEHNK